MWQLSYKRAFTKLFVSQDSINQASKHVSLRPLKLGCKQPYKPARKKASVPMQQPHIQRQLLKTAAAAQQLVAFPRTQSTWGGLNTPAKWASVARNETILQSCEGSNYQEKCKPRQVHFFPTADAKAIHPKPKAIRSEAHSHAPSPLWRTQDPLQSSLKPTLMHPPAEQVKVHHPQGAMVRVGEV